MPKNVLIIGAAGRDYHNFITFFRDNKNYTVKCFTANQIPDIEKREFPKELAGKRYKKPIPTYPENMLEELIKKFKISVCVLSYSDLSHEEVMHKASVVNAAGADFWLLGNATQLKSKKKIISICAVRTGCGKSSTTLKVCELLKKHNKKFVVVRHPMPYGDLIKQEVQRFATFDDLDKNKCTIEEREEYEPHINAGNTVYAGVDYKKILLLAEKEADIIVWDGGNNDLPFFKSDLQIVVTDPHRAGHEIKYYPGETNFRGADVIIINKENTAKKSNIEIIKNNIKQYNKKAIVIDANSEIIIKKPELIKRKKVVVVEDGPTLTHGGMSYGAGLIVAQKYSAQIISPQKYAIGEIKKTFEKYPHLSKVVPAMGYSKQQIADLEQTLNNTKCDVIIDASPFQLAKIIHANKPIVSVSYKIKEVGKTHLEDVLKKFKFI